MYRGHWYVREGTVEACGPLIEWLFRKVGHDRARIAAMTLGHVVLSPLQLLALFATNILGVLPFCAIGLYIGTVFSAQAAPAVINILYLPMAFLAGLWMPLSMLPALFAKLAPLWPAYHLAQIALAVVGLDNGGSVALHALVLLAVSVVFFGLARRRLARA